MLVCTGRSISTHPIQNVEENTQITRHTIYQYIHNLNGIVEVLYEPPKWTEDPPPSLGVLADSYLSAHGYMSSSVFHIHRAYMRSYDLETFSESLCSMGMSRKEARWIWGIISVSD